MYFYVVHEGISGRYRVITMEYYSHSYKTKTASVLHGVLFNVQSTLCLYVEIYSQHFPNNLSLLTHSLSLCIFQMPLSYTNGATTILFFATAFILNTSSSFSDHNVFFPNCAASLSLMITSSSPTVAVLSPAAPFVISITRSLAVTVLTTLVSLISNSDVWTITPCSLTIHLPT